MRILHFGDIHLWNIRLEASDMLYLKRWLGPVNLLLRRRKKFPVEYGQEVLADILKQDVDAVIFSGDMTTNSLKVEFKRAAEALRPVHEKWGDQFVCIPGNHDRYTPKSVRNKLYEKHFPYGVLEDRVRTWELSPTLSVIGFDCSVPWPLRSNGQLVPGLLENIEEHLKRAAAANRSVILVGHYPFTSPADIEMTWEHKLLESEKLQVLVETYKPTAYLHGHKHVRWALPHGDTLCLDCGSAGMMSSDPLKQAGYIIFETDEQGKPVKVETRVLEPGQGCVSGELTW